MLRSLDATDLKGGKTVVHEPMLEKPGTGFSL